jgi:signal-transduction protein with cAMP-binding, CBS, and nucleotidyltransferase domain
MEALQVTNRSFEGLDTTLGGLHLSPPTVVSETDSLTRVASALLESNASCALLNEPPLRLVTESGLVRALARGVRPEDEVAAIAFENPNWVPPSASVAEAAALMASLGIRHLVVLDMTKRARGLVSMQELFDVLVRSQDPMAHYARFADIMLHTADKPFGQEASGREQKGK